MGKPHIQSLIPWWQSEVPEGTVLPQGKITNPWDIVTISGIVLPGISKVEVSHAYKLDVKESAGKHFSTITTEGYKPCDVIITTRILTPLQWRAWQTDVFPALKPLPNASWRNKPFVFSIEYPSLQFQDITEIVIETITGPNPGHEYGIKEIKIKALQWNAAIQAEATKTPKKAKKKEADEDNTPAAVPPSYQQIPGDTQTVFRGPGGGEGGTSSIAGTPGGGGGPPGGYAPGDAVYVPYIPLSSGGAPSSENGGAPGSNSNNQGGRRGF